MKKTKWIAVMGLMLAIVSVLTYIEHSIPPIPFLPPNVKLGLSNIITMFCLYYLGRKEALLLAFLKSGFVFLTRGMMAGILSLSGGVLSVLVLIFLTTVFKDKISFILASVLSAIAHNVGQYAAISILMQTNIFAYYLPILIILGVVMGIITGILLKTVMPALKFVI